MTYTFFIYLLMTMTTTGAWAAAKTVTPHENLSFGGRAHLPQPAAKRPMDLKAQIDSEYKAFKEAAGPAVNRLSFLAYLGNDDKLTLNQSNMIMHIIQFDLSNEGHSPTLKADTPVGSIIFRALLKALRTPGNSFSHETVN